MQIITKPYNWFFGLFILLCFANLFFEFQQNTIGIYCTKPLLMTILALFFYLEVGLKVKLARFIFFAIVFSIAGDTLLMFTESNAGGPLFFLAGLGSFLVTHILYSLGFLANTTFSTGQLKKQPFLAVPYLIFFGFFLSWIWAYIPADMLIPVVAYSMAILFMQLMAINLKRKSIGNRAYFMIVLGALFFMISDSLIAVNRFMGEAFHIDLVRIWIMSLYLLGQALICLGIIRLIKSA